MYLATTALFSALAVVSSIVYAAPDYPLLAAHFTETHKTLGAPARTIEWHLTRRENEVDIDRGPYSESWQRDARDEISLTRYFHQDRKRIQYTVGELLTQRRAKKWTTLNSVFDADLLKSLTRHGTLRLFGRPAERYSGTIDNEKIEVIWLTRERLAAKFTRTARGERFTLALTELRATPGPHWLRVDADTVERYDSIDGADLGDMEYDPFVARVLASDRHHEP